LLTAGVTIGNRVRSIELPVCLHAAEVLEALRRMSAKSRGLAMGAYTSFLGISLDSRALHSGLVALRPGLVTVFLVRSLVRICAVAIALRLVYTPKLAW